MEKPVKVETTRYENLPILLKVLVVTLFCAGLIVVGFYTSKIPIKGWIMFDASYYYLLIAVYLCTTFIIIPARKKDRTVPCYDFVASGLAFGIGFYFFLHGWEIRVEGWDFPSRFNFVLAFILLLLVLEGGRRMGGFSYLAVAIIFGLYPLFAGHMPGMLMGMDFSFINMVGMHVFGAEGLIGLPTKVVGEYLIGFLLFAGILISSGAGEFFLNFALALFGRFRGGPAKVAVVSSGFFGSLSGSIASNIVATGSVTIPSMKRIGYPPHYAAAIEACASTGGVLMPPVMGAAGFVMCMILSIDYYVVVVAAAVPAILYYYGLLMQVDAYAGKAGLKGLPPQECPSIKRTLKSGWPFIAVLVFLVWGLVYMRWEMSTPFYASGLMFLLSFTRKETIMTPKRLLEALVAIGRLISQTMAIILPLGIIISGLTVTGISTSLTAGLVALGGGNLFLILLLGVLTCYLLGMAGLLTPAYIFLALTLAPAVLQIAKINVLALHLFIIYYAMLSSITPPVALGAFIGATIADAHPMRTALQAMRLGVVIYFIPFFFVFNPALILQGRPLVSIYYFGLCLLGITLIAGGMEGYLLMVGKVRLFARLWLVLAGLLIAFPEWKTDISGAVIAFCVVAIILIRKKTAAKDHIISNIS